LRALIAEGRQARPDSPSLAFNRSDRYLRLTTKSRVERHHGEETTMAWSTPTLVEICVGLEISGYLPAEF
jgi:hypothetical protein